MKMHSNVKKAKRRCIARKANTRKRKWKSMLIPVNNIGVANRPRNARQVRSVQRAASDVVKRSPSRDPVSVDRALRRLSWSKRNKEWSADIVAGFPAR